MVVDKVSSVIGLHVSVDEVYPILWNGISLHGVQVRNGGDTVLYAHTVTLSLDKLQLDSSYVSLEKLSIFRPDIRIISDSLGVLSIEPLLQALQSSDTSSSFRFHIQDIEIRDGRFVYRDYSDTSHVTSGLNFSDIRVTDMNAYAHALDIHDAVYKLAIDKLSCKEQSGLSIQYLNATAQVSDSAIHIDNVTLYTPSSKLSGQSICMTYDSFDDFSDFITDVHLDVALNRSSLACSDIAYFAPVLEGYPYQCTIEGRLQGVVSDFITENLHIGYGRSTQFVGSVSVKGLPDFDAMYATIRAEKLETNSYDVSHTKVPPYNEDHYFSIPDVLKDVSFYKFSGIVKGNPRDFSLDGTLRTSAGKIAADVSLRSDTQFYCDGNFTFEDLDIATFVSNKDLFGTTTGSVGLKGSFCGDSIIDIDVKGAIDKLECNDYAYTAIDVDGKLFSKRFFGRLSIDDANLQMKFRGLLDLAAEIPKFRFQADVASAQLDRLHIFQDTASVLSFSTRVDFEGSQLDDMNGSVALYDVSYANNKGSLSTKNIALNLSNEENERRIKLYSAFLDASVEGRGNYSDLFNQILNLAGTHITSLPEASMIEKLVPDFKMKVDVKNIDTVFSLLMPEIRIASGSHCEASYLASNESCVLSASFPMLTYNTIHIYNCIVNGDCSPQGVWIAVKCSLDSLQKASRELLADCTIAYDSVKLRSVWRYDDSFSSNGEFSADGYLLTRKRGELPNLNLHILPTVFSLADSVWNIAEANVMIDTSDIAISGFKLYNDDTKILVDGTISHDPEKYLVFTVENYGLDGLNPFIANPNVRLAGNVHGRVRVKNLYQTPLLFADVHVPNISFNEHILGALKLRSFWDNKSKSLLANGHVSQYNVNHLACDVSYTPHTDSIHCNVSVTDLNLATFAEVLQGVANDMQGVVDGDVDINGVSDTYTYSGEFFVKDGSFVVDYTQVPYTFSGCLRARKTYFSFRDFVLHDADGNKADVHGFIDIRDITNPHYLFDVQTDKILLMKTTSADNDYFYGTIYYNGMARIDGDLEETSLSGSGTTLENTICSIPVSYSELSGVHEFLLFSADTNVARNLEKIKTTSGIQMDLQLHVTPDAQAQIIFDPKVGDAIKARGTGDLQVKMNRDGDLSMFGKYQIEEGDYLFTLKNLINKKLILQKGGTIVWNGDPLDAQVDLAAQYELKASPQPLFDSSMNVSKRIPVTCQAFLKNNLLSPDISYGISVPSSSTQVSEILSTLSEDETTLQFFSLLLQNSFMSLNSDVQGGGSMSLEVFSNQFNNLLSQIDPNLDVTMNYRIGTNSAINNEFEFGFSRQFWNDRILVNANGYTDFGNNSNEPMDPSNQNTDFSGNVSVEMKLNKQGTFKVKGFSRSNDDVLTERQENTQGVGLFYTKDFNRLRELFRKQEKE